MQVASLNRADPRALPIIIDAFTVVEGEYIQGLVDLNLASAEVLAAIPGISSEAAAQIVDARVRLSPDARQSALWPLAEKLLEASDMTLAIDYLTTRSCQWRVIVEGGFVRADDRSGWQDLAADALEDRVVLEAVIDIASERPRVAYLREITLKPASVRLAASVGMMPEEDLPAIMESVEAPDPLRDAGLTFGNWADIQTPVPTIPEVPGEGPIEPDADDDGSMATDRRIGRWTPGPARKDEGR
jgi:hypothetical protein